MFFEFHPACIKDDIGELAPLHLTATLLNPARFVVLELVAVVVVVAAAVVAAVAGVVVVAVGVEAEVERLVY